MNYLIIGYKMKRHHSYLIVDKCWEIQILLNDLTISITKLICVLGVYV